MKKIYYALLLIVGIICQTTAQTVTLTPSVLTTASVTTGQSYNMSTTGVPHIKINLSGFSCSPLTYDWETVSWTPVFSGTAVPTFNHPLSAPAQPNPSPNSTTNANSARYVIRGPGIYTLRLCVSACGGTQMACGEMTIIAQPQANVLPEISFEDITELTLPIAASEQLDATVKDITDQHSFTWSQGGANPTSLSLPTVLTPATNPTNVPRGSSPTLSQLNLSTINKPGTYSFTVDAADERGGAGTATETFLVKPAASTLVISITQPGLPPDPSVLYSPVNHVPLKAQITGMNVYNDKIRYTWSLLAGPTDITLPTSAYTANINDIPIASSIFEVPVVDLHNLAYGIYTLKLRVEDEYYSGAFVEQEITFTVKPPESNLNVSISPLEETILTKKAEIFEQEPQKTVMSVFEMVGTITGIHEHSDVVKTYWQIVPEKIDDFDPTEMAYPVNMDFELKDIMIGNTTASHILKLEPTKIKAGTYVIHFVAEDTFYGKKVETSTRIIIQRPIEFTPSLAFSPNGDSQNDVWQVKNIESFPDVGVRVVNERGELVFETASVANLPEKGWNGQRKDGKNASEGAYYYEFYNNQDRTKLNVGSLVIVR